MFSIEDGQLRLNGRPFTALGVNYHPSRAGCRIWTDWHEPTLADDFTAIGRSGLNTVRLFLFWRDAQPRPGEVDPVVLGRLAKAVSAAAAAGLHCVVSLFTIWMNGELLDLPWRGGRDVWRDPVMVAAEEELAVAVARVLRGHDNVLAYDLGDELWNIDPAAARSLSRSQVAAWQGQLADRIRAESPGALVLQANDASGVFGGGPHGADNSAGLDVIGIHGFPSWTACSIESTLSYKATNLVPFLVRACAAYGTPLVDELGAYGVGDETSALYLQAATASALGNGAAGVLVWCWQDIASVDEPYQERPLERRTGLNRLDGSAKPAMDAFRRAATACPVPAAGPRPQEPAVLYLPDRLRRAGASYLDGDGSTVAAFYSYLLLKRAHLAFAIAGGDRGGPGGRPLVLCPAPAQLTLRDIERLRSSAEQGATVYLSMVDHLHGFAGVELCGVEIVDTCGPLDRESLHWDGESWPLDWTATRARPTRLRLAGAEPLATYPDGSPALTAHQVGRGEVVFTSAPVEAQLDRPGRLAGTRWESFYRRLASRAGVAPSAQCPSPDVEVLPGLGADGQQVLLVNHAAEAVCTEVVIAGGNGNGPDRRIVELDGKGWMVLDRDGATGPGPGTKSQVAL